jgi:hypothetical protein
MAAMIAARIVVRLAGLLPVRLVAAPSVKVTSRMVRLDGPVLVREPRQVVGCGLGVGQACDGVDSLAGGLAGGGDLLPQGGLDGLTGAGEVQAGHVRGLEGAGLGAAVASASGEAIGVDLPPGQLFDPACSSGWLPLIIAI